MKNTKWIKEMSWTELQEAAKTCDTIIIPCGAVEGYGPHMPLGSDIIVSHAISERVAARVNALIAPCIEMGESFSLGAFPGTMVIRPETYAMVVRDQLDSLIKWGFKNFMFMDMHAGNVPIISQIAREYQQSREIHCAQIDWWRFVQAHTGGICQFSGWRAHGHASECGTSVMLYLHPEYVDMDQLTVVTPQNPKFGKRPDVITYYEFSKTTPICMLGDAPVATREKGQKIVEACVDYIVDFMKDEFQC